jgi:hypothetical protein
MKLIINEVEEYLKNNAEKKLSIKTIRRELNMKSRKVFYLLNHSSNIRQITPIEVGSNKYKIHVYCYNG